MKKTLFRGTLVAILVILALSLVACKHKHAYGDWVYSAEPTCSQTGEKYRECKCGERETIAVAPLGVHKLENNICTMCGINMNPYFFNLFKSLLSEDYPLVIKELSLTSRDKTAHYSFKNTELIASTSGEDVLIQLIGACQITKSGVTKGYDFVGVIDGEAMCARLITEHDGSTADHYLTLPLSAVKINSELSSLEENLRENALVNHSSTLSLLVNAVKEWRRSVTPEIIAFCESHFEEIAPFLNDYFTSLFEVTMIDDRVGLELNFSKIKEFNNTLYNEKVSALYEKITKKPYGDAAGEITDIMNTTVGELLRLADEDGLDINEVVEYCFSALYNLRVISSSKIPDSISEKLSGEYAERTLLSIIAEQTEADEASILDGMKSALSKIGELTGYQYAYRLAEGNTYDKPTADEDAALRDIWASVNSRLVSFASFASTTFVTSSDGEMYSFKMTFRAGGNTINIRLDKEYEKTIIPTTTLDEIREVTSTLSRDELKNLSQGLSGMSVNNGILTYIYENVNESVQNTSYIEEFNLDECIMIYSPQENGTTEITIIGSKSHLGENGEKLDTCIEYTSLTLIYNGAENRLSLSN